VRNRIACRPRQPRAPPAAEFAAKHCRRSDPRLCPANGMGLAEEKRQMTAGRWQGNRNQLAIPQSTRHASSSRADFKFLGVRSRAAGSIAFSPCIGGAAPESRPNLRSCGSCLRGAKTNMRLRRRVRFGNCLSLLALGGLQGKHRNFLEETPWTQ